MKNRFLLLAFIAVAYIGGNLVLDRWPTTLYYGDSNGYYLHVVSFFVNQDVGDYDKTITTLREVNPYSADPREDKYGIRLTEKGKRYIKYTLGVPVMETPFFLLAHAYTKLTGHYDANGWTKPYLLLIGFSIICYVLIGFYLLIGILERYFSPAVTTLSVLAIAFASNIFFHATYVTMSHGFLFFDYCLLLYLTIRFYDAPSVRKAFGVGAVVGLIALTRVPEVVSALIPLLWGIHDRKSLQERLQLIRDNWSFVVAAPLGFLLVFSLQFIYWYYVSGHLVFNPYEGEGFDFMKPHLLSAFFDFKNGWLIYTPIMAFSLIGWWFLRKYCRAPQLAILAFVGLHAYIHYSYYAWTYFPGLGQRPMVETYPLLSFCLAAFFIYCRESRWWRWLPLTAIVLFSALNLFQTWQMKKGLIWSERGNSAFYWATFGKLDSNWNTLRAFDSREKQPDEDQIILKNTLYQEGFEDTTRFETSSEFKKSGEYSLYQATELVQLSDSISLSDAAPGDWLKIGLSGYIQPKDHTFQRDILALLSVELYDETGKRYRERNIKLTSHIGNEKNNIWSAGDHSIWDESSFYLRLPAKLDKGWKATVKIYNPHGQKMNLDDFFVEHYVD